MIKMVYDIEEKDIRRMRDYLALMEETRYFIDNKNCINELFDKLTELQEDIEQTIDDSRGSGKFDEFNEVLQLYLYDKDYS
tara:strand:+ start:330 stop:572 length:243 start_codon:yes stop_codon:yes gene_type:complete